MNDMVRLLVVLAVAAPLLIIGAFHVLHVDQKIKTRGFLLMASAYTVLMIEAVLGRNTPVAGMHAALAAWFLFNWWNNGGGDGLRRLAKKLRSFTIGRTPAPQAT